MAVVRSRAFFPSRLVKARSNEYAFGHIFFLPLHVKLISSSGFSVSESSEYIFSWHRAGASMLGGFRHLMSFPSLHGAECIQVLSTLFCFNRIRCFHFMIALQDFTLSVFFFFVPEKIH